MVGLQGSGKTTTTAKIAKRLTDRQNRKVLMASLDVRRPGGDGAAGRARPRRRHRYAAGRRRPDAAADRRARIEAARLGGYDVVMLDTAGRTTLDEAMMNEAAEVKRAANPHEVLLVADALTGQDAVNLARAFDERVGLTGIVLTRVDGDGRGGAALSMRAVTGKPIKLIGTGEKLDALEEFDPARIAGRILGMGDIVALVEKAAANIDAEKAARAAEHMRKGAFDLADLRDQLGADAEDGRPRRPDGHDARRRQDEEPDRQCRPRRQDAQAPEGDHQLDDAAGAAQSGHAQEQPQEAHRRRLRHDVGSVNKLLKMHRGMADMMKAMGARQARPDGRARQDDGHGRRRLPSPEQMAELAKKMPGGSWRHAALPPACPADCRRRCRGFPASAAENSRPGRTARAGKKK